MVIRRVVGLACELAGLTVVVRGRDTAVLLEQSLDRLPQAVRRTCRDTRVSFDVIFDMSDCFFALRWRRAFPPRAISCRREAAGGAVQR